MKLSLGLDVECSLCGQPMGYDAVRSATIDVNLFGAVAYAVCPCCKNPTGRPEDPDWRKLVDEWVARCVLEESERS